MDEKFRENIPKKEKPTSEIIENSFEVERRPESQTENLKEKEVDDQKKQGEARDRIDRVDSKEFTEAEVQEKISRYVEKHLPEYLKEEKPTLVFKLFKALSRFSVREVIGKENLPKEEKLFIVNHRGGESGRLIAALDSPVHLVSAERINWIQGSFFKWFLEKIGAVPVKESFSHLSEDQKRKVVERAPKKEREAHAQAVQDPISGNIGNIRTMVALLLKGGDVAIFAEGPFSRLEEDERRSYAGYALVAREYKRVSKKDLNIVPTGIRNSKVSFGESFQIDQEGRQGKEELEEAATEKIHSLYNSL